MIGQQSNIVGLVSDGDNLQVRLVVVTLIVVLVVFTAGVQQTGVHDRDTTSTGIKHSDT